MDFITPYHSRLHMNQKRQNVQLTLWFLKNACSFSIQSDRVRVPNSLIIWKCDHMTTFFSRWVSFGSLREHNTLWTQRIADWKSTFSCNIWNSLKYRLESLILIDVYLQTGRERKRVLSTRLSPDCGKASGVFNTSHKGCCVFSISQHKHYNAALKVQEDILGQSAKVWRLQRKLIYETFLVWLISFRAEEKHSKALVFQHAGTENSSKILEISVFILYGRLW